MPRISILIPAYNHEAYVTQTLESIKNDTFPDKEVIIIDDGSTDDTARVIEKWIQESKGMLPVTFRSRPNKGLTKTLNELLFLASGEYLVALASDDYLLEGGLQKRLDYLLKHPEKSAVFADCIVVDAAGRTLYESGLFDYRHANRKNLQSDRGIQREFITHFAVPGPVLMVRRDYYKDFGGFNEEMYMEDYDLYLRFAAQNRIGFIDAKVSAYRLHETNMSRPDSANYLKLLQDSKKTLRLHRNDFHGINRLLLERQILKFSLRIWLQKLKNR